MCSWAGVISQESADGRVCEGYGAVIEACVEKGCANTAEGRLV